MMAAVAILGIGVTAMLHGLSGTMEARRRVDERAAATSLVHLKLAEYVATEQVIEGLTGSFETPFERYTWRVQASATERPGLFRLTVDVSWPGRRSVCTVRGETLTPQQ